MNDLRPSLKGLSTFLFILTILSGIFGAFGLLVGVVDGDPAGFMIGIAGVGGIISCTLGRVIIYIAVVLEDIASALQAQRGSQYRPTPAP